VAGAAVVCADINPDRADEVADAIRARGGRALAAQGDVANRFQMSAMIEAGREAFGKVDLLVCAAGVHKHGALLKIDEWDWRRIMDVNMTGTFFALQLMARVMADEGGGAIVTLASDAAAPLPIGEGVPYAASKQGIVGMSLQAAHELAQTGSSVRVNVVCARGVADEDATTDEGAAAALVLFLLSDAAQRISGQRFVV
jgi:NAD(P)-dependent dehydrogenase (short-subunit alcohol dehydrogenase family)